MAARVLSSPRVCAPRVCRRSAACPTAAGIFATLNEVREQAGQPPLGFLNPLIYRSSDSFNDVTEGYNNYCDEPSGFPATNGWDAATGVGSPNFPKLKQIVTAAGRRRTADGRGRGYTYRKSSVEPRSSYRPHSAPPPAAVNWNAAGAVSPVRNQGQGETCWAFSAVGAVEGARVASGGAPLIALSPQELIDCAATPGGSPQDCSDSSSTMNEAFSWLSASGGLLDTFTSYARSRTRTQLSSRAAIGALSRRAAYNVCTCNSSRAAGTRTRMRTASSGTRHTHADRRRPMRRAHRRPPSSGRTIPSSVTRAICCSRWRAGL